MLTDPMYQMSAQSQDVLGIIFRIWFLKHWCFLVKNIPSTLFICGAHWCMYIWPITCLQLYSFVERTDACIFDQCQVCQRDPSWLKDNQAHVDGYLIFSLLFQHWNLNFLCFATDFWSCISCWIFSINCTAIYVFELLIKTASMIMYKLTSYIISLWRRFHHGVTKKKRHKNCSPGSCICDLESSYNVGANASLAEQKNSKNAMLAAVLPHVSQAAAHDLTQIHSKMINQRQKLDNMCAQQISRTTRQPDDQPTYVVDAINLVRVARRTHYQRDHLENGTRTERQTNPNPYKSRVMIPRKSHKLILKSLATTSQGLFDFIPYSEEVHIFLQYIRRSRPALNKFLEFEKDGTAKDGSSRPLQIRLHQKLLPVKDTLLHWAAKNHETQILFPQVAHLLKPFFAMSHTSDEYSRFVSKAPRCLSALVLYGSIAQPDGTRSMQCNVQALLRFSLKLQHTDTSSQGMIVQLTFRKKDKLYRCIDSDFVFLLFSSSKSM